MRYCTGYTLHGLVQLNNIINEIIDKLKHSFPLPFVIELILTEALTNAYMHGNKKDALKPIYLQYFYDDKYIAFEIKDCGEGGEDIKIPREIADENLLSTGGRGLYLINCYADIVKFNKNKIIIILSREESNEREAE